MTRSALTPYLVLTAIATMALGGIFALLGELRDELGFSESELGFMVAMGFFAGFAAQVWLSRYADRGHAKVMITVGQVFMILGLAMMVFVSDLWWFVAARVVLGMGVGVFLPAVRRIVIVSDSASVGANVGLLAAYDVGGFVVGPLLAGFLAHFLGFRAPFIALAAVLFASLPLALRLPPDRGAVSRERRVIRALLEQRAIRAILFAVAGWFVMIGSFEAVWALLLDDLGAEVWLIGLTTAVIILPMVAVAPRSGAFAQKVGPFRVVIGGLVVVIPCVISYGFIDSLTLIVIVAVVQGGADAFVYPAMQVGIAVAAGEDLAASAQGLQGALLELTAGLVALVAGVVFEQWGRDVVFVSNGVVMIICVGIALLVARPLLRTSDQVVVGTHRAN